MKTIVKLDHVSKSFIKDKYVIKDLSLEVHVGEFLTLLGSSGCGKTTILRLISVLENVTSGKVYIDFDDVTDVEPQKREVNTIFQYFGFGKKTGIDLNGEASEFLFSLDKMGPVELATTSFGQGISVTPIRMEIVL